ncbi:MAG: hypothetical protein ACTSUT_18500 [Promethearchaeota archaeon]
MKNGNTYIIGHFKSSGASGNDSADLNTYLELGWELISSGFWIKCNANENDTIISSKDRLFMYRHLTDKLIPYEDYQLTGNEIDVSRRHQQLTKDYNERLWTEEEIQNIQKINDGKFSNPTKYFICVQVRRRDHCSYRNGAINSFEKMIKVLSEKYKIYVVGKLNEHLDNLPNVQCINLDEYCFLIKSKKCVMSVGVTSGCMMLNYLYGRKNLPVYLQYTAGDQGATKAQNHILYFGKKINVAGVKETVFYNGQNMFDQIIKITMRNKKI